LFHGFNRFFNIARRFVQLCVFAVGSNLLPLFSVPPARAELTLCNQSLDVLNVSLGYELGGDFQTEGWWSIGANRCSDVVRKALTNRYYYVYAEDVFGQPVFEGDVTACVNAKKFVIKGAKDCWLRGGRQAKFSEIDTLSQDQWTVFLKGAD
jgi:uncharacterized membrane protein